MTSAARVRERGGALAWLLGAALLALVVSVVAHFAQGRDFVRLLERAQPWWVAAAFFLQAATYLAQGAVWRRVVVATGGRLSLREAFDLGLAKLFADQAIPSAGLSSAILTAKALQRHRLAPAAVRAAVLVNVISYPIACAVAIAVALAVAQGRGAGPPALTLTATLFLLLSAGFGALLIAGAGRPIPVGRGVLARVPCLGVMFDFVSGADARRVRDPRLLTEAVLLQFAIVLLDAATLATLLAALGSHPPLGAVFVSFVIASLVRTIGIVPGGLGTFELASVVTLRAAGADLATALSATLLFRGLTFWLPMIPGFLASRRVFTTGIEAGPAHRGTWWAVEPAELLEEVHAHPGGLTASEAAARLAEYGRNEVREQRRFTRLGVLGSQFKSPLLSLLLFAAAASALSGEWIDGAIVLAIVVATVAIGASREYSAQAAAAALRARVRAQCTVLRDGGEQPVAAEAIVPGDVLLLAAGSLVPADARLLEATDFFVSEAVLTGESFPVQKQVGTVPAHAELASRTNCVFLGTNVRSGTARALVVSTGAATQFGAIAGRLTLRPPETEFDRGIRRFGYLLTSAMLIMVLLVFVAHVLHGRPPIETLLFAVALAVGLSPELLPAILSVNLARGARSMASRGVLVRRLNAIENLGSMDVLCTDKTGTLTEGVVQLDGAWDTAGRRSNEVLELGAWNAALETGIASPLDDAILTAHRPDLPGVTKLGEIPFDFVRKRVTVVVRAAGRARFVTKGAFHHVLEACTSAAGAAPGPEWRQDLERRYAEWAARGVRVLAVASRDVVESERYAREDEGELVFEGFLTFLDRPKEGVADAIAALTGLGVATKLITGDARLVAQHVAGLVGLRADRTLTGGQLDELNDEALWREAERTDLFVEVDPNQKERIILALKKTGHVVGFLGDGVNDAPAMHAADTSLSVEQAVDVAREAADFVLLERGLDVIRRGIEEGRRTFANTLKYVLMTTSANLGNMVSMAAASLFLPFLPLTAGQILLNNFLSDLPAVGIADDSVDAEMIDRPRRWDIRFIGRFMVEFGVLSSLFDLVTFAVLLGAFHSQAAEFRTSWFVESLLTELVVALVMRTRRPFWKSRPGAVLLWTTLALIPVAFAVPYLDPEHVFGFVPLPAPLAGAIAAIAILYVAATEALKLGFYRRAA